MTISEALAEAYANVDVSGAIWDTIEIDHPTLGAPLYFVRGTPVEDEFETLDFPVAGITKTFKVVDFLMQRPGVDESGPTKARLRMDNVSQHLNAVLRDAIASDQPFDITYRCYWSTDMSNPEIYSGLRMGNVSLNAFSASGDLFFEEIEMKAFPAKTYNLDDFPALYDQ